MISLSANIRKHMEERGITGSELAAYVGVTKGQVSRYLNKGTIPRGDTLYEIAQYLGVTVEQLMTEST